MNNKLSQRKSVLQLTVQNHPGVMSHVCGLFARRAYNLEGIVCLPVGDGKTSRMLLLVNEDEKLEQVIRQTRKLVDVIAISQQTDIGQTIFDGLSAELFANLC
jgi:acetolactate synthase-1/3 small subunit